MCCPPLKVKGYGLEKVLFQITEDQLETGMRGYPVGYCTTSFVDPMRGLFYAGKGIGELADWEPEQVLHLVYYGREGSVGEISAFKEELGKRAHCSKAVVRYIEELPRQGHPMKLFSAALLILGMLEGKGNYREDALNLIAKLPHLVAAIINHHAGWGETPLPELSKGYMENFTHMVQVPHADKKILGEVFRLFNILHYDHGGGNLSAFVGKAVASGLEDLYGAMSASMSALSGPRHGKANQDCLTFAKMLLEELGTDANDDAVESFILRWLNTRGLLFGFGHAVLRQEDIRATLLYDFAIEHYSDHPLVKIALMLREVGTKVLKEQSKISNPYPNVDAISGTVLTAAGFPYPEYYTLLFGLSRSVGIATQIVYERSEARAGRGTPIVRPRYIYKGKVL